MRLGRRSPAILEGADFFSSKVVGSVHLEMSMEAATMEAPGRVDGVKDKSCVSSALQGLGAKPKILLRRMIVSSQLHSALIDSPIHYCSRCVDAGSPSEAHDRGGEGLPKRLVEIRAAALPS